MARDYSEFSALKKQVAYAAITASRGFGWRGTAETGFSCLLADQAIPPVTGDCRRDMVITYQASGEVESSTWQVNPWRDWYEPWISRINEALEGFDDLPDPAGFDGPIGKLYEAAGQVTASPVNAEAEATDANVGNTELGTSIAYVSRWLGPDLPGAYNCATVRVFDDMYGGARMLIVTGNQRTAVLAAGLALVAEKQIWVHARTNIMDLMEKAKAAFDGGGGAVDLTVVKAFADLAVGFVPGGGVAAKVVGQVATSTGFLKEVLPKVMPAPQTSELSAGKPDQVAAKFDDAIVKLRRQIFETEAEVYYTSDRMLDIMFAHTGDFHIHPAEGVAPEVGNAAPGSLANQINADLTVLKEVGYRELPQIAGELARSAQAATTASGDAAWARPANIGWGAHGAHYKWKELVDAAVDVTSGTANELVTAGQNLAIAAGYLEDTDGWSAQALKDLEKIVAGGSQEFSEPPPLPAGPPNYATYR